MAIEANPTTYTVLDFLKWQKDGTLDLRPPFQRNAVWRPVLRSSLIDSILRGYPIPALFLQDRSDSATFERRLVVIDGQQRLRTILSYVDASVLPDRDERDDFTLLRIHDPDRAGKTFQQLADPDRDRILGTRLSVYVVGSAVTERELLEIFRRMNTYGAKLNAQELRNAEYGGLFKEVVYRLSAESLDSWLGWGAFSRHEIAEMRDAEFTSDLMLLFMEGRQASTRARLDAAYKDYSDEFKHADDCIERFRAIRGTLQEVLFDRSRLRRLTSRMWIYTLFDVLQTIQFGGSIEGKSARKPKRVTDEKLLTGLSAVQDSIEAGTLPELVGRATRGAANDKQSREARAAFLLAALQ